MTFEREIMAGLCLAVVWVNTGLIVAHGLGDLRRLLGLRRCLQSNVGRFEAASPEAGATYQLVQAGRTRGDGSIHFHDRRTECSLSGHGRVESSKGTWDVTARAGGVWVWPTPAELRAATACASREEFDALAGPALLARGAERVATVRLDQSWVAGGRLTGGVLHGEPDAPLVFSTDDPRARLAGLCGRVVLVLGAILTVAAALTGLCFVGPAFGSASVAAALGLFVYFLLVQPLGVWLSESVRWPHEVSRGGRWIRERAPAGDARVMTSSASSG